MEKINFSDKDFIYRLNIGNYSKENLVKEILVNVDIDMMARKSLPESPGIQSDIIIRGGELDKVTTFINDLIIKNIYKEESFPFSFKNWVYLSESTNNYTFYHQHIDMAQMRSQGEWTWTLYIQMPDNLGEDEGKLIFMLDDESIHEILPNEGDLLVFPAKMLHKPQLNRKSTKPRIVLGGIISKIDFNKNYNKKTKTAI